MMAVSAPKLLSIITGDLFNIVLIIAMTPEIVRKMENGSNPRWLPSMEAFRLALFWVAIS